MCPAGTFVKKDCSEFRSTSCEPCPDGTYQEEPTGRGQCQRCRMCAAGERNKLTLIRERDQCPRPKALRSNT
ncbi:unnamed protein product [Knipowitschia caucasica]